MQLWLLEELEGGVQSGKVQGFRQDYSYTAAIAQRFGDGGQ